MLCLDSPSFEHNCVLSDDLSWSPSASKLVDTCKNCSYSFRIGSKNSSEGFCSKGTLFASAVCKLSNCSF